MNKLKNYYINIILIILMINGFFLLSSCTIKFKNFRYLYGSKSLNPMINTTNQSMEFYKYIKYIPAFIPILPYIIPIYQIIKHKFIEYENIIEDKQIEIGILKEKLNSKKSTIERLGNHIPTVIKIIEENENNLFNIQYNKDRQLALLLFQEDCNKDHNQLLVPTEDYNQVYNKFLHINKEELLDLNTISDYINLLNQIIENKKSMDSKLQNEDVILYDLLISDDEFNHSLYILMNLAKDVHIKFQENTSDKSSTKIKVVNDFFIKFQKKLHWIFIIMFNPKENYSILNDGFQFSNKKFHTILSKIKDDIALTFFEKQSLGNNHCLLNESSLSILLNNLKNNNQWQNLIHSLINSKVSLDELSYDSLKTMKISMDNINNIIIDEIKSMVFRNLFSQQSLIDIPLEKFNYYGYLMSLLEKYWTTESWDGKISYSANKLQKLSNELVRYLDNFFNQIFLSNLWLIKPKYNDFYNSFSFIFQQRTHQAISNLLEKNKYLAKLYKKYYQKKTIPLIV